MAKPTRKLISAMLCSLRRIISAAVLSRTTDKLLDAFSSKSLHLGVEARTAHQHLTGKDIGGKDEQDQALQHYRWHGADK